MVAVQNEELLSTSEYGIARYAPSAFAFFHAHHMGRDVAGLIYYTTEARDRFFAFGHDAKQTEFVTGRETYNVRVNGEYADVMDIRGEATMKDVLYEMALAGWIVTIDELAV